MRTDVLIEMVGSILGADYLCEGCGILREAGEKANGDVYGSCCKCREAAAGEIIERLRASDEDI